MSLQPWQVETKRCVEAGTTAEFNQSFYLTTGNHFFTIKIEVINAHAGGLLEAKVKESIISAYEIRIPDLKSLPFKSDGSVRLPVALFDPKKCGLAQVG